MPARMATSRSPPPAALDRRAKSATRDDRMHVSWRVCYRGDVRFGAGSHLVIFHTAWAQALLLILASGMECQGGVYWAGLAARAIRIGTRASRGMINTMVDIAGSSG